MIPSSILARDTPRSVLNTTQLRRLSFTNPKKDLFKVLDRYFVESKYRKAVLRFLGDYFQSQPPHLHQILETPLFQHILMCLQHDTSTMIVSLALTSLIMLLSHMPSSLVPHLPDLFNIYARLLFWSRERSGASINRSDGGSWQVCGPESSEDLTVAHLQDYYTILYGLYPLNFMDYIRKPQRYLRHANVANANDVEVQPTEIRDKSERFRKCHLLHPNFYTLTLESEKTDFGRWLKSEASEVAADCMSLCLLAEFPNPPDSSPLSIIEEDPVTGHDYYDEGYDTPILSRSVEHISDHEGGLSTSASMDSISSSPLETASTRQGSHSINPASRETLEIRKPETSADSPTLPPHLTQSSSYTQLQDMIQSNKAIKSALNQSLANDSVPSLSLSQQGSVGEKPSSSTIPPLPTINAPLSLTESSSKLAQLQRQVLILQNDLNFETYQKQQHMARIGDLRRKRMEEAVTESEMQNLMMTNRSLKNRFEEAKKAEMQVRRDSEKSRALAKKWEADLSNKMKTLRDESKKLNTEVEKLKKELDESKMERQKLLELVCEAEVKELGWRQDAHFAEMQEPEVQRLKGEMEELMVQLRDYQAKEVNVQEAATVASQAKEEFEILKLKLKAREEELRSSQHSYQDEMNKLGEKFTKMGKGKGREGSLGPNQISKVQEQLAASRAKQAELQRQLDMLSRKYRAIQSSFLDFKVDEAPAGDLSKSPKSPGDSLFPNSLESKTLIPEPGQGAPRGESPSGKSSKPAPASIDVLRAGAQARKDHPEATERTRKSDEKKESSFKGIRGYV